MKHIILLVSLCTFSQVSYGQNRMITPINSAEMFDEFFEKEKFLEQPYPNYYSGLADDSLRSMLSSRINRAAEEFMKVAESDSPSVEKYHEAIDEGLSYFDDIYIELDSEELDRIGTYFEEIMDIVGLQSSGGRLNIWRYGFDPTEND